MAWYLYTDNHPISPQTRLLFVNAFTSGLDVKAFGEAIPTR